jgi:hypothetical protein
LSASNVVSGALELNGKIDETVGRADEETGRATVFIVVIHPIPSWNKDA